jgi:cytochrome c oxidase cbb3-type subunit 2
LCFPLPWLARTQLDGDAVAAKLRALQKIGVPYSSEDVAGAPAAVAGHTEMDALIAYLQSLKFRGDDTAAATASSKGQP